MSVCETTKKRQREETYEQQFIKFYEKELKEMAQGVESQNLLLANRPDFNILICLNPYGEVTVIAEEGDVSDFTCGVKNNSRRNTSETYAEEGVVPLQRATRTQTF